jgi:hypothetical protein
MREQPEILMLLHAHGWLLLGGWLLLLPAC